MLLVLKSELLFPTQVPLLRPVLRGNNSLDHLRGSPAEAKYDKVARLRHSSDHSSPRRVYLPQGILTTCRSLSCLACELIRPRFAAPLVLTRLFFSEIFSSIFLFMVDVKKSRVECEEFVAAEASREAITAGNM